MLRPVVKPNRSCHSAHSVNIQAAMTPLTSITSSAHTTMLCYAMLCYGYLKFLDEVFITRQQLSKHMKDCKGLMTDEAEKPTSGHMKGAPSSLGFKKKKQDQESAVQLTAGLPDTSTNKLPSELAHEPAPQ